MTIATTNIQFTRPRFQPIGEQVERPKSIQGRRAPVSSWNKDIFEKVSQPNFKFYRESSVDAAGFAFGLQLSPRNDLRFHSPLRYCPARGGAKPKKMLQESTLLVNITSSIFSEEKRMKNRGQLSRKSLDNLFQGQQQKCSQTKY